MNKLLKLIQALIFTILIVIIGVFIWQFFNAYAQLLLLPLGILSVYYLLIYTFVKLLPQNTSKTWYYTGLIFIIIPLVAFSLAYDKIIDFSYNILNSFGN